jgi:hypothetical protein
MVIESHPASARAGRKESAAGGESNMPEPLPEQQKTMLIVRSPLSEDGVISIYFSSRDGRLMNQEEWWHLQELIELTNKMCVKQQARAAKA